MAGQRLQIVSMLHFLIMFTIPLAQAVDQQSLPKGTCQVAGSYNLLQNGNSQTKNALQQLEGAHDQEKLNVYFNKYFKDKKTSDPSKPQRSRYDWNEVGGVLDEDVLLSLNEFLEDSHLDLRLERVVPRCPVKGSCVEAVFQWISKSLQRDVPVLLGVQVQTADWSERRQDYEWAGQGSHTVTVTQAELVGRKAAAPMIQLQWIDPMDGKIRMAILSEETEHPFIGLQFTFEDYEWLDQLNPFLVVSGPSFAPGAIVEADWNERILKYVTSLIGDFE